LTLGGTLSSVANSALTNSSVTVTAGTGMSGGGAVALGSSVTLTNAGVTSIVAGTGISISGATGAVTVTNSGGAPGMVLVQTITVSAGATISALSAFSGTYDNYLVIGQGLAGDLGSPIIRLRYGISGSAHTGNDYLATTGTNAVGFGGQSTQNTFIALTGSTAGTSVAQNPWNFRLFIYDVNTTARRKQMDGLLDFYDNDNAVYRSGAIAATLNLNSAITGVQLLLDGGSFRAQGNLRIYGFSNS